MFDCCLTGFRLEKYLRSIYGDVHRSDNTLRYKLLQFDEIAVLRVIWVNESNFAKDAYYQKKKKEDLYDSVAWSFFFLDELSKWIQRINSDSGV